MLRRWDDAHRGVIAACDFESLEELASFARATRNSAVIAYKIGFSLALRFGLAAAVEVVRCESSGGVIYDHQKAGTDIPDTSGLFASAMAEAGVDAAIVFPLAGPATGTAVVRELIEAGVRPIVGLAMTHPSFFQSEGGFIIDEFPEAVARLVESEYVTDIVLPSTKLAIWRRLAPILAERKPLRVMLPGIGSQGGAAYALREIADAGHDVLPIVGRSLAGSDNPAVTAARIIEEVYT